MIFLVILKLALAAFEKLVSLLVFLCWAGASAPQEAGIALFSSSIFVPFAQIVESLWLAARGTGKLIPSYLSRLIYPLASGSLISCLYFFNCLLVHHLLCSVDGVSFQSVF